MAVNIINNRLKTYYQKRKRKIRKISKWIAGLKLKKYYYKAVNERNGIKREDYFVHVVFFIHV